MVMPLPDNVTTAELLRWVFDRLNDHDVASLRRFWTPETVEYFPDATSWSFRRSNTHRNSGSDVLGQRQHHDPRLARCA